MLDRIHTPIQPVPPARPTAGAVKKYNFSAEKPENPQARTAGDARIWTRPVTARQSIQNRLSTASKPDTAFESALAYNGQPAQNPQSVEESYDIYDVLDVINPLQHIPLVNLLYRGITGDEIKPPAKIIGGAIFGGAVGAAVAAADTVIQHETGRTMAGNAVSFVAGDAIAPPKEKPDAARMLLGHPEKRLERAVQQAGNTLSALPGTALAFADLSQPQEAETSAPQKIVRKNFASHTTKAAASFQSLGTMTSYAQRYNS